MMVLKSEERVCLTGFDKKKCKANVSYVLQIKKRKKKEEKNKKNEHTFSFVQEPFVQLRPFVQVPFLKKRKKKINKEKKKRKKKEKERINIQFSKFRNR